MLDGIRVIDASTFVSGPMAGLVLADLGADVIKVEQPGGDPFRRFGTTVGGTSLVFSNVNRGKRSVVLDLRAPSDRRQFEGLLAGADIAITNWRPEVAERFGLTSERVAREHSQLVWVRVSGFGTDGPLAGQPVFDSVIQAMSGLAASQADERGPQLIKTWMADKITALFVAQAALSGLMARQRIGRGCVADVPMLDALSYFNFADAWIGRLRLTDADVPAGNAQLRANRVLRTKDGWIVVSPVGGRQLGAALDAMGMAQHKAELKQIADPAALAIRFYELAEQALSRSTTAEWLTAFESRDVPAAPMLDFDEHLRHPQVVHNGIYELFDDPLLGTVRRARHPVRFVGEPTLPPRPAPRAGEHQADVLG